MQNIIWTNDTGQIDAIIEEWRQEALSLAVDMAKNPKETVDEATYGVDVILNKAWKNIVDGYEIPTAQRLFETINSLDILDARIRIAADELNTEYRADEQDNLRHLELEHRSSSSVRPDSGTVAAPSPASWTSTTSATSSPTAPGPVWNTRHGKSTSTTI